MSKQDIIDEYTPAYCRWLQLAYGQGLLSEGGFEAMDDMFTGMDLSGKRLLEVGCGLGGMARYIADKHYATVKGIEINPHMIKVAKVNTPNHLRAQVSFDLMNETRDLSYKDASFDIVYSKGVLTHESSKSELFDRLFQLLKPGGCLVIVDWLSSIQGQWGPLIDAMCSAEGLTLYAETPKSYREVLEKSGFKHIEIIDKSVDYRFYNEAVLRHISRPDVRDAFIQFENDHPDYAYQLALDGYQCIVDAIQARELLVMQLKAWK
jgi:2-polyprenyl-3-methyl-5-hydroxy-6-metoxy-1,4-benzoquinol methylase